MIVMDGVRFDIVVQRELDRWLVADSDGTVYARLSSEVDARAVAARMEAELLAQGGRRA